jgi:hypothetical protein
MTVHTFLADSTVGGSGGAYTDDGNPTTGLDNGGHRVRLVPMFTEIVNIATFMKNLLNAAVASASASAATAVNAPGTSSTSTTSLTVGIASVTFNTQAGKAYAIGQFVVIADTGTPANFMVGQVTAYNSGTGAMTVNVTVIGGSGTFTTWTISLTAPLDGTLSGRVSALETEQARLKARRRLLYRELA